MTKKKRVNVLEQQIKDLQRRVDRLTADLKQADREKLHWLEERRQMIAENVRLRMTLQKVNNAVDQMEDDSLAVVLQDDEEDDDKALVSADDLRDSYLSGMGHGYQLATDDFTRFFAPVNQAVAAMQRIVTDIKNAVLIHGDTLPTGYALAQGEALGRCLRDLYAKYRRMTVTLHPASVDTAMHKFNQTLSAQHGIHDALIDYSANPDKFSTLQQTVIQHGENLDLLEMVSALKNHDKQSREDAYRVQAYYNQGIKNVSEACRRVAIDSGMTPSDNNFSSTVDRLRRNYYRVYKE